MTITTEDLLKRNSEYVQQKLHTPMPTVSDMMTKGLDPAHLVILTCADPRATPDNYFQLHAGEVIILRNVGGQAVHALNDLLVLDTFVHISEIVIVHHTDCGATHVTESKVREDLIARLPERTQEINKMQFGGITNLEKSISDDIAFLKGSPYIRPDLQSAIRGFLFNIQNGGLKEIL